MTQGVELVQWFRCPIPDQIIISSILYPIYVHILKNSISYTHLTRDKVAYSYPPHILLFKHDIIGSMQ